jgi:hypothetical protein
MYVGIPETSFVCVFVDIFKLYIVLQNKYTNNSS